MKKIAPFIMLVMCCLLCCLPLAACDTDEEPEPRDFITDELHCIVSLPQEYDIFYVDEQKYQTADMFDIDLYSADTVNGKPKKDGFDYFNVLRNEPFRILTPEGIIQNKRADGQTLCYWKLNDELYNSSDSYESEQIFTCSQDTEITPVYYGFRPVGMALVPADEEYNPLVSDDEIIAAVEGRTEEQKDVYYLYGVYDFEPYEQFWRKNITVNKWTINFVAHNEGNYTNRYYKINAEISVGNLFKDNRFVILQLCKIEQHGYMLYGYKNGFDVITGMGTIIPLGKHSLNLTFAE